MNVEWFGLKPNYFSSSESFLLTLKCTKGSPLAPNISFPRLLLNRINSFSTTINAYLYLGPSLGKKKMKFASPFLR